MTMKPKRPGKPTPARAMSPRYDAVIRVPFGVLGIRAADGVLTDIDFLPARTVPRRPRDAFTAGVVDQLYCYCDDPGWVFSLPLHTPGTPFQQRVWRSLRRIPTGATRSYGALAEDLRSSPRAVGGACRANPIAIVIPCHRVVGVGGLVGFNGASEGPALAIKRWLLAHEGAIAG